ncbi:hypothetical protein [Streptomyces sp. NPDC002685]|uniref:hypothetical protein n=1 Tax=Streptomyces sp. NPDC002685 TaxID=3154540 RepID=UPI00331D63A5
MHRIATATLLAAGLLLAGCSSGDGKAEAKPSSSPTKAGETTAAANGDAKYDEIWDGLGVEGQKTACDLLAADGPGAVSYVLDASVDDPSVDTKALAEYFNDEKC